MDKPFSKSMLLSTTRPPFLSNADLTPTSKMAETTYSDTPPQTEVSEKTPYEDLAMATKLAHEVNWSESSTDTPRRSFSSLLSAALGPRRSLFMNLFLGEFIIASYFTVLINISMHTDHAFSPTTCLDHSLCMGILIMPPLIFGLLAYFGYHTKPLPFKYHTAEDVAAERARVTAPYKGPWPMTYRFLRPVGWCLELLSGVAAIALVVRVGMYTVAKISDYPIVLPVVAPPTPTLRVFEFVFGEATPLLYLVSGMTLLYTTFVLVNDVTWCMRMVELSKKRYAESLVGTMEGDVEKGEMGEIRV